MKFVHISFNFQVNSSIAATTIAMNKTSMPMTRNIFFALLSIVFIIGSNASKYKEFMQKKSIPLFVRNVVNNLIYNPFLVCFGKKRILNLIQRKSELHIPKELIYLCY